MNSEDRGLSKARKRALDLKLIKKPEKRWLKKEQWIAVLPYLQEGKEIQCGSLEGEKIACRPLLRYNKQTPFTIPELLKIHSKEKLISLAKEKERSPKKRIDWFAGEIII